jgi:hypothetical protein
MSLTLVGLFSKAAFLSAIVHMSSRVYLERLHSEIYNSQANTLRALLPLAEVVPSNSVAAGNAHTLWLLLCMQSL